MSEQTTLSIGGMRCQGCASAVEEALAAVDGVAKASVSLEQNMAQVEGTASVDQLIAAVIAAGYQASAS